MTGPMLASIVVAMVGLFGLLFVTLEGYGEGSQWACLAIAGVGAVGLITSLIVSLA